MNDTYIKKSKFARGTIVLLLGGLFCKFLGAFYRIPLSNILGPEGIGIYQLIFPVFSLFLVIISGGISVSLSKLVAQCLARNESKRARRFLFQSILYLSIISLFFSLLFLIFRNYIAEFQGNINANFGYIGVAIAIIFASVLTAFRGYFQGHQNMNPTAISQIIEQSFKLFFGLTFAYIFVKKSFSFGVFGAIIGIAVSEFFAFLYLFITYLLKKKKIDILETELSTTFLQDFKILIKQTLPITLNSTILPLILAIDSFLIVNLLKTSGYSLITSTEMFGVYSGMVNSLVNFPTIFSMSIAICLVPYIAYEREKNEKDKSLDSIFKIIFFIAIPCFLIFLMFSKEIISILYPKTASGELIFIGESLLKITSINVIYISLLQISTAILQANGKSLNCLFSLTFAGIIKILLTMFFVPSIFGIYGAAIASIMCYAISAGLNIVFIKSETKFNFAFKPFLFIILSSLILIGVSYGFNLLFLLILNNNLSIIFSILISGFFYLFFSLLFPIFNEEELNKIPFGKKIILFKNKFLKIFNKKSI